MLFYPPYSQDLAPTDYHLFRSIILALEGKNPKMLTKQKTGPGLSSMRNKKVSIAMKLGICVSVVKKLLMLLVNMKSINLSFL